MAKLNKTITKELILETLRTELTVQATCKKLGISRQTYYRWLEVFTNTGEHPFLEREIAEAIAEGVRAINDYAENELVKKIYKGDIQAIKFWLTRRHEEYKQAYIVQK